MECIDSTPTFLPRIVGTEQPSITLPSYRTCRSSIFTASLHQKKKFAIKLFTHYLAIFSCLVLPPRDPFCPAADDRQSQRPQGAHILEEPNDANAPQRASQANGAHQAQLPSVEVEPQRQVVQNHLGNRRLVGWLLAWLVGWLAGWCLGRKDDRDKERKVFGGARRSNWA